MRLRKRLRGITILLLTGLAVKAQQNQPVTITTDKLPFKQFVLEVESKTNYRFYYNPADLDSISVTVQARDLPLKNVLESVLGKTPFKYAVDQKNRVFIIRNFQLQTELPRNYFVVGQASGDSSYLKSGLAGLFTDTQDASAQAEENRLIEVGDRTSPASGRATLSGYVRNQATGEPIAGATIAIGNNTVTTNQVGFYSIQLPKGRHTAAITSTGMKNTSRQIALHSDGDMNIELTDYVVTLKSVTVAASQRASQVKNLDMGVERVSIKTIKQVPVVFGQADVLRTVLALPGVTSVGEASTGFNVRGGSADQNLILFNDATIYNPSHFFGFFSAFNAEAVKGLELYKSSIPSKYGGRIASVLDVAIKEGNKKKFGGSGGIGPLTSQLTLEGPFKKDKSSFLLSGRTTYSDWILKTIPDDEFKESKASFYDINAHISHQAGKNDFIYLTAYMSRDKFRLGRDTTYAYGNTNFNVKWKHNFKNNAFAVFTGGYDSYQYSISGSQNPLTAYDLKFKINQAYFRADFTKSIGATHRIDFGLNSILYELNPGSFTAKGSESRAVPNIMQKEKALETALYISDEYKISDKFSIDAGLRYSFYASLGPSSVLEYAPGLPRDLNNVRDTVQYGNNAVVKTYSGPEVRVSARYLLGENASVKISYNTLRQYIHMLSNTTAISPTDIWKLSDRHIKPQQGQQVSLGFYKTFPKKDIETSVEVYYKTLRDYLDYKSGAQLVLNDHIETDVLSSKGKAYGVEVMVKRNAGKLNGWVSYTYSRTFLQTDDPLASQPVNKGDWYPSNFDKPHAVNLISNYRVSHRLSFSFNGVYSTGRPITLPIAIFNYGGADRVYYSDRNQFRIPDYFRMDFSMNIEGNHKRRKLAHSSWTMGVYNVTARKNPYSVYFVSDGNGVKGYSLSIFGTAIPFITYNFKF